MNTAIFTLLLRYRRALGMIAAPLSCAFVARISVAAAVMRAALKAMQRAMMAP